MMSGTSCDPDTLVELVRGRECLYNPKCKEYKSRPAREKAWMEIARTLGMNPKDCERKWKNLKDSFNRQMQSDKAESRSGAGAKKKKWYLTESLSFLTSYNDQDGCERNSNFELPHKAKDLQKGCEEDIEDNSDIDDPCERRSRSGSPLEAGEVWSWSQRPNATRGRGKSTAPTREKVDNRKTRRKSSSEIDATEKAILDALKNPLPPPTEPKNLSACELFLRSLVPRMEALTPRQQLDFQLVCLNHFSTIDDN